MSINPLTHQEIEAWSHLTRNKPQPWEVVAIRSIDVAFVNSVLEEQSKPAPKP